MNDEPTTSRGDRPATRVVSASSPQACAAFGMVAQAGDCVLARFEKPSCGPRVVGGNVRVDLEKIGAHIDRAQQ